MTKEIAKAASLAAVLDYGSRSSLVRTEQPLISFEKVSRVLGRGRNANVVLRDVDLEVLPGTRICIEGQNGAGKTTLLRIAAGILAAQSGRVVVDGIQAGRNWREYHRRIGFLSAGDRGLYNRLSVRAHLDLWASIAFIDRSQRQSAVDTVLLSFGLLDLSARRAERLSQGQRQRLRLALALMHKPKVLLLDEPRNSLDAHGLEILTAAVDELLLAGSALIWCSPKGEQQPIDFDRTMVIRHGTLAPQ